MQGIYMIHNQVNNKCYVGQSLNINKRFRDHKTAKQDYPLYRALRKYGIENFEFVVLEIVENIDDLLEREQFWYDELEPEYNQVMPSMANRPNCRKVLKISKDSLKVISEYDSVSEASRNNTALKANIIAVCKSKKPSAGGYYWCYKDSFDTWVEPICNKCKPVVQIEADTNKIIKRFASMLDAGEYLGVSHISGISKVCQGKRLTAHGYKWAYEKEVT